jgi:hypothetical protein
VIINEFLELTLPNFFPVGPRSTIELRPLLGIVGLARVSEFHGQPPNLWRRRVTPMNFLSQLAAKLSQTAIHVA